MLWKGPVLLGKELGSDYEGQVAGHHGTEAPGGRGKALGEVDMHELLGDAQGPQRNKTASVM